MESVNLVGPILVMLAVAGALLLADAFLLPLLGPWRGKGTWALAVLGPAGAVAWGAAHAMAGSEGAAFQGAYTLDAFSLYFALLVAAVTGAAVLVSPDYLGEGRHQAEYYALMLASGAGLMTLAGATDLISLFVALELTSLAQFVLVGFLRDDRGAEAAIKYIVLGAISAAITLYGIALLFGATGHTSLAQVREAVPAALAERRPVMVLAFIFLAAGLGFKMAIVPFQMWVPDVYQGAPTPVTAYLSVASKAGGFAAALRVFVDALGVEPLAREWATMFAVLSALSMVLGNVMALVQSDIKRMLGYSSIAQAGYFLIGLAAVAAGDPQWELGTGGVLFFLGSYAFTNMGAFAVIIAISRHIGTDEIADYSGMARRSPLLALALTMCLVSLTGIPPTAGFVAKLYVFNAAIQAHLVWLAVLGVVNSVVSAYYYLRVVLTMFVGEPAAPGEVRPTPLLGAVTAAATVGLLVVGIFPFPLLEAAERAAGALI